MGNSDKKDDEKIGWGWLAAAFLAGAAGAGPESVEALKALRDNARDPKPENRTQAEKDGADAFYNVS